MKIAGIIAEYNPFHKGHEYQINEAKKVTGADAVLVVMSGDFTQRGTPTHQTCITRTYRRVLSHRIWAEAWLR